MEALIENKNENEIDSDQITKLDGARALIEDIKKDPENDWWNKKLTANSKVILIGKLEEFLNPTDDYDDDDYGYTVNY